MTTITLPRQRSRFSISSLSSISLMRLGRINTSALASMLCMALFLTYFLVPHAGIAAGFFKFSIVYVVIAPILAFAFSIVSVRQIARTHDLGLLLSAPALVFSSLYIITGLALPLVLVGCYVLYAYILR